MSLMTGEDLRTRKLLQVLVICGGIDSVQRGLGVMWPFLEGSEDVEEPFVIGVVVQLHSNKSSTVKCYRYTLSSFVRADRIPGWRSQRCRFHQSVGVLG